MKKTKRLSILILSLAILLMMLGFILTAMYNSSVKESQETRFVNEKSVAEKSQQIALEKEQKERKAFIAQVAPVAQEIQKEYHILASITIAQASLESDWGRSKLSSKYNNYFGVKGDQSSRSVSLETKEFENGHWIKKKANFMVYNDIQESMIDHAKLLKNGTTWNNKQYQAVIDADDYVTASKALLQAGYATDPTYAKKLIEIIEQYQLYQYDKQ